MRYFSYIEKKSLLNQRNRSVMGCHSHTLSIKHKIETRNWVNYFIDSKQKHNNKMYSLNYVLNNI